MTIIQKNLCLTLIEDQQNLRWIEIIHLRFEKCAFTIPMATDQYRSITGDTESKAMPNNNNHGLLNVCNILPM